MAKITNLGIPSESGTSQMVDCWNNIFVKQLFLNLAGIPHILEFELGTL
jgi:hypothetical protein